MSEYAKMHKDDLVVELAERGLSTEGTKDELVERLLEADGARPAVTTPDGVEVTASESVPLDEYPERPLEEALLPEGDAPGQQNWSHVYTVDPNEDPLNTIRQFEYEEYKRY